jgi:murein L,D-transpeptidase YafK
VTRGFLIKLGSLVTKLLLLIVIYPQITGGALTKPVAIGAKEKSLVPDSLLYFPLHRPGNVLLVEKSTQKAYLYQTTNIDCPLKVYPCSTGENKGPKSKRNDKRTPEGVYFTTNAFKERDLPSIYGARAFPIDYPNQRDRKLGRKGSGIWLHGTNEVLKPRDTRGCVAFRNEDIIELSAYISERHTPIVITSKINFVEKQQLQGAREELKALIVDWVEAWSKGHIDHYMSFYDMEFTAVGKDWHQWRAYKRRLSERYGDIEIEIDNLQILRGNGIVLARFDQTYRANGFFSVGEKRLYIQKKSPEWKIAGEFFKRQTQLTQRDHLRLRRERELLAIKRLIADWQNAWQEKDLQRYMVSYSEDFTSQGLDRAGWERHKSELNKRYARIGVIVSNLRIKQLSSERAVVCFDQVYKSDTYQDRGKKTLQLVKRDGIWKIKREIWVPTAGERRR